MVSAFSLLLSLLTFSAAVASCGTGFATVDVDVMFDSSPLETTVDLVDYSGVAINTITLTIPGSSNTLVSSNTCAKINTLYKVAIKDSAGNGLSGQAYVSLSVNNRLIASISDYGSEATFWFVADGEECTAGETRATVNLKFDGFPSQTAWNIRNTGTNGVVVSQDTVGLGGPIRDRNTAALANQFLNVDKCLPAPGSYSFSITDANGIASPGFYRFFNEYDLLDVGGSASGTQTTAFTTSSTPAPTPTPITPICDDDQYAKIQDDEGVDQPCIWLGARPAKIAELCPIAAVSSVCRETCGVCTDSCVDNSSTRFTVNGLQNRNCEFVRVRIQLDTLTNQANRELYCDPTLPLTNGANAWTACKETCENCPDEVETPAPVTAPTPGTPATPGNPSIADPCDDSVTETIYINQTIGAVPCRWLAVRQAEQATYCAIGQASGAYSTCEETCGKCADECEDANTFVVNGVDKSCSIIADDPTMISFCSAANSDANTKCKESCGNCVGHN